MPTSEPISPGIQSKPVGACRKPLCAGVTAIHGATRGPGERGGVQFSNDINGREVTERVAVSCQPLATWGRPA